MAEEATSLLNKSEGHLAKNNAISALEAAKAALKLEQGSGNKEGQASALCAVASAQLQADAVGEAVKALKEASAIAKGAGSKTAQLTSLLLLVKAYGEQQETDNALQTAKDALAVANELADKTKKAAAMQALVGCLLKKRDVSEASKLSEQAQVLLKELGDRKGQLDLYNLFINQNLEQGEATDAVFKAKEAMQFFQEAADKQGLADALRMKAKVHIMIKEPDRALKSASKALALIRSAGGTTQDQVNGLYTLMDAHLAKMDADAALKAATEAVTVLGESTDRLGEAAAFTTVADLLVSFGEGEAALSFADEAMDLLKTLGETQEQAALLLNTFVNAKLLLKKFQEAEKDAEDAVKILMKLGNQVGVAEGHYTVSRVRMESGNTEEALWAANEVVDVYEAIECTKKEAEARHMVCYIHQQLEEWDDAVEMAEAAAELYRKLDDKRGEAVVLETLTHVRIAQGEMGDAEKDAQAAYAVWTGAGDKLRAAQSLQAVANIRIAKGEFKEVVKDAKAALKGCQKAGDEHGEAQHLLSIAAARLAQVEKSCPKLQTLMDKEAGKKAKEVPTRRLMEALMMAKEALTLFRDLGDGCGEAAALQAVAKVYRFKLEPITAVATAKEAAVVAKAVGDMHGAATSLLLEATTYFMMLGFAVTIPAPGGGQRLVAPEDEALCAATEAHAIYRSILDKEGEAYAAKVLEAAKTCFPKDVDQEALDLLDVEEPDPLSGRGFQFRTDVDVDPRECGRKAPGPPWTAVKDPVMERLMSLLGAATK